MIEAEQIEKTEIAWFASIFRPFLFSKTCTGEYMKKLIYSFCENLDMDDDLNVEINTYKKYYTGSNDITKLAPILLRHRASNSEIYQVINELPEDIQDFIEKQIKEKHHEIDDVNLGAICVELFWNIVNNSINKKRKARGKSIKLKRIEATEDSDVFSPLEEDINHIIVALSQLNDIEDLSKLSHKALKINQKVTDPLLCEDIKVHVTRYYRYIESEFKRISKFTK